VNLKQNVDNVNFNVYGVNIYDLREEITMSFESNRRRIAGIAILLLSLVGIWSALAHYLPQPDAAFVAQTNPPPGKEWYLEQMPRYASRPTLTALHVIPAALFMLLAPLQLSRRIRSRYPNGHRWSGRVMVAVSLSIGLSGIIVGILIPFGGEFERVISVTIGVLFLVALGLGVRRARQKRFADHRQWMLRMLAIGFVPVTMRGLMISGVTMLDLHAPAIFGPTMLLGLLINLAVVEYRLRQSAHSRQSVDVKPAAAIATT